MSALSKDVDDAPINKGSFDHFLELSESTKINADIAEVDYPKGWYLYVEEFIDEIKDIPVEFLMTDGSNRQLYFKFIARYKKDELKLLKAASKVIEKTRDACAGCGIYTLGHQITRKQKFCRDCYKNAWESGKTGTWLDSYIKK